MAQTVPTPTVPAPQRGAAVLVIDGNEEHQILSVTALGRRGFRVAVADTAREGLRLALTERFDAIVLAHKLRDAAGLDVLRVLHERLPRVPLIFVVTEGSEEIAVRALGSGASGHLVKTPRYHELLPSEVEEQLAKARDQAQIEDQKRVLTETQARFREFIESTQEPIFVLDATGGFVAFNEAMCTTMGYSKEELARKRLPDLLSPRVPSDAARPLLDFRSPGPFPVLELPVIRRDGREIYLALTPHPVQRDEGVVGMEVLAKDVTERKRAEEQLKDLYGWLKAVYESTTDAILLADRDLRVIQWNAGAIRLFGTDDAGIADAGLEALARRLAERAKDPEAVLRIHERYEESPDAVIEGDIDLATPETRVFSHVTAPVHNPEGVRIGRLWTFRDVTDRRVAELELVRREAQLAEAQRIARLGSWETDLVEGIQTWSDELYRILGWEPRSFKPDFAKVIERTVPEDRHLLTAAAERMRVSLASDGYDHRIRLPDGALRTIHSEGRAVLDAAGRPVRLVGTAQDVTEIRRGEKVREATYRISAAATATENLDALFASIHRTVGGLMPAKNFYIALYDGASRTLSFPYFADEQEPPPPPQALGRGLTEYVLRTGKALLVDPIGFQGLVDRGEVESVGPPSVDWLGAPLVAKDQPIGVLVVQSYTDGVRYHPEDREILQFVSAQVASAIDRMRADQALRESEERFRRIAENAQDLIYRYRLDEPRGFEYVSPASMRLTGYTPEEHYADPELGIRMVHPEDRHILQNLIDEAVQTGRLSGKGEPITFRWIRKDGKIVWTEQRNVPILDGAGRVVAIEGIARDATDRVLADQDLRASEERFRLLAKAAQDAIWDWNADTDTLVWSEAIHSILRCEPGEVQPTGSWIDARIHPDERERILSEFWATLHEGKDSWTSEYRLERADGSYATVFDRGFILRDADGRARRVIGSLTDISGRKRAEEQLIARERQQAAVASLGQRALEVSSLRALFDETVGVIAKTLDVEFAKILELHPTEDAFLLRAGVGWKDGLVGTTTVPANLESQGGFTLRSQAPVLVEDLRTETRFQGPALLRDHGIVSGMSVTIQGPGRAYGVLGVHTTRRRSFTQDDVNFLLAVANVLAGAVEQARAEATLRSSEERYRMLFASNPHPMWVYGVEDLRILAVNDAAVRHYGYTGDEFLSMTIKDIRPPEDVPALLTAVADLGAKMSSGGVWRHRKKNGSVINVEIASHPLEFAGRPARLVLATDVTERLRAREDLERSERKFRALFDAAADAIVLLDPHGRVLDVNPAGEGLSHATKADLVGMNILELIPAEEKERALEYFRALLADEPTPEPFEATLRLATEARRSVEVRSRVLRHPDVPAFLEMIVRDVTEQKEMQKKLVQSERLASMGQLSAFVAHEINTPLTSISLLTASIARKVKDEEILAKLEKINAQRRHAAAIIADLLTFSKHREIRAVEADLREIVDRALEQVEGYRPPDVSLDRVIGDGPVRARVDPLQIQEVVVNLVKNGLQATTSGTVSVRLAERPDAILIEVTDTGAGMPPEVRAHLFEPFFTTKAHGEGTGLGLSMCQNIVTAHGGKIEVSTGVGRGSTFTVVLPKEAGA